MHRGKSPDPGAPAVLPTPGVAILGTDPFGWKEGVGLHLAERSGEGWAFFFLNEIKPCMFGSMPFFSHCLHARIYTGVPKNVCTFCDIIYV